MSTLHGNLIRKQYMVSKSNIEKLTQIAAERGSSVTEVVRRAIDAYDPTGYDIMEAPELMNLVSDRLREAIKSTRRANHKVKIAITNISQIERNAI